MEISWCDYFKSTTRYLMMPRRFTTGKNGYPSLALAAPTQLLA